MRFASAILVLALAGCSPQPAENPTNDAGNAVENQAVVVQNNAEPAPAPEANAAALPDNSTAEAAAGANGLPAEVQKFIERREGCEHWAGEPDWDNAERKKQIEDAVKELCPGIDTQLAAIRKRYAGDPAVTAALKDFEPLGMDD